jgi:hypothetical protein
LKKQVNKPSDIIFQILINKYRVNPETLRCCLPEVIPEIEKLVSASNRRSNVSGLTEIERERLLSFLFHIPKDNSVTKDEAIRALEYCATLIQDESLPNEIDRKVVLTYLHYVINSSLSDIDKKSKITLSDGVEAKTLAILRGVYLHLTWNDKLIAVSISPTKMKERPHAMRLIGIDKK